MSSKASRACARLEPTSPMNNSSGCWGQVMMCVCVCVCVRALLCQKRTEIQKIPWRTKDLEDQQNQKK